MSKIYQVFISHSWDYSKDLLNLRDLLIEKKYFNVDFNEITAHEPINSENAVYIKSIIRQKIKNSNVVLGLAGMYANYSDWMIWELDTSLQLKVPIIGVIPWGQQRISKEVSDRAVECVRWNTDSIVDAIRRHAKFF